MSPVERPPTVGVYRFWRDFGFVVGALLAGFAADALGFGPAIAVVAALTAASGAWVAGTAWTTPRPSPLPSGCTSRPSRREMRSSTRRKRSTAAGSPLTAAG